MTLSEKILAARKQKGLTQEELAAATNLTVRTIQRIESGETTPRSFTVKALANGLGVSFEDLSATPAEETEHKETPAKTGSAAEEITDKTNFLPLLCLSCFSYLVVPYVHFLIPAYWLRQKKALSPAAKVFVRGIIRTQVYWVIALNLLLFLTLGYNIACAAYGHRSYLISYLVPFFGMYFLNTGIITYHFIQSKKLGHASPAIA